jgi:hypothetical protein
VHTLHIRAGFGSDRFEPEIAPESPRKSWLLKLNYTIECMKKHKMSKLSKNCWLIHLHSCNFKAFAVWFYLGNQIFNKKFSDSELSRLSKAWFSAVGPRARLGWTFDSEPEASFTKHLASKHVLSVFRQIETVWSKLLWVDNMEHFQACDVFCFLNSL